MVFGFPEYGRLRRVLMHSPGTELDLVKPTSFRKYLFEDAVDQAEFRRQHENLRETLRAEGVDVVLLHRTLPLGSMSGLIKKSPNLVYTRDTVTVVPSGYIEMRMKNAARRYEPRVAAAALQTLNVKKLTDIKPRATMEGGDMIFLDEETLLVGVGNRTNLLGLHQLRQVTQTQGFLTLIAVPLPPSVIHLDGTMMIVDQDLAIVHRESLIERAIIYEEGKIARHADLLVFLKKRGFRLIGVTGYERRRRATNVITLGPRKLVVYSGNARVKSLLAKEGVDFIEFEGSELVRGGGGPRCMTSPIQRDWRNSIR